MPIDAVLETPVNETPISIVNEPIEDVACWPVGIWAICSCSKPTDEVVERPFNSTVSASRIIPPTEAVVLRPVNPTVACTIVGAPTLEVVDTPVGTITESIIGVKLPTLDVALTPVGKTKFSIAAVNDPTLDVVLNPASWTSLLNESP